MEDRKYEKWFDEYLKALNVKLVRYSTGFGLVDNDDTQIESLADIGSYRFGNAREVFEGLCEYFDKINEILKARGILNRFDPAYDDFPSYAEPLYADEDLGTESITAIIDMLDNHLDEVDLEKCSYEEGKKTLEDDVNQAVELYKNAPCGRITDGDTILADIMENADFDINGLFAAITELWLKSSDRHGLEELFYTLADCEFKDYIDICIRDTMRKEGQLPPTCRSESL